MEQEKPGPRSHTSQGKRAPVLARTYGTGAQQLVLALADGNTPQAEVAKGPHKGAADETAKTVLSVVKAAATVGDRSRICETSVLSASHKAMSTHIDDRGSAT